MLDPVSDNAQSERDGPGARLGFARAIDENARQRRNLGDPAAIVFALNFDPDHVLDPAPRRLKQAYSEPQSSANTHPTPPSPARGASAPRRASPRRRR